MIKRSALSLFVALSAGVMAAVFTTSFLISTIGLPDNEEVGWVNAFIILRMSEVAASVVAIGVFNFCYFWREALNAASRMLFRLTGLRTMIQKEEIP